MKRSKDHVVQLTQLVMGFNWFVRIVAEVVLNPHRRADHFEDAPEGLASQGAFVEGGAGDGFPGVAIFVGFGLGDAC